MRLLIREHTYEDINTNPRVVKWLNDYLIDNPETLFVWNGCHKIYLVENQNDIESVKQTWGTDTIFYSLDKLPEIWYKSCPLRFIHNWSLTKRYVEQFNDADFEFID